MAEHKQDTRFLNIYAALVLLLAIIVGVFFGAKAAYLERSYARIGMCVDLNHSVSDINSKTLNIIADATDCYFLEDDKGRRFGVEKASIDGFMSIGMKLVTSPSKGGVEKFNQLAVNNQSLVGMFSPALKILSVNKNDYTVN